MLVILDHVLLRISFISLHRPKYKIIPAKRGSAVTITVGFVGLIVSFQNLVTRQIMIFHCFDIFSKHKSQNGKRVKGCPHNPTHDEEGRGSFLRMNRERGRSGVSTHSQREEVRSLLFLPFPIYLPFLTSKMSAQISSLIFVVNGYLMKAI